MSDFALDAVNWNTVDVLGVEHLEDERRSLEELLRCGVNYRGAYGVARLEDQDLVATSRTNDPSETDLTLRLRGCQAITPKGYLVYIHPDDDANEDSLSCTLNRFEATFLYVGVGAMQNHPAIGYNAGVRKRLYMLATTEQKEQYSETECLDWLIVGSVERSAKDGKLGLNTDFIPECLSLQSHAGLRRKVDMIRSCAADCCDTILKQMKAGHFHNETFSYPLAVAATVVDKRASPRSYLERLLAVVRALDMLQLRLQEGQARSTLKTHITTALTYIEPHLDAGNVNWAKSLDLIKEALCSLDAALGVSVVSRPAGQLRPEVILTRDDPKPNAPNSPDGGRGNEPDDNPWQT